MKRKLFLVFGLVFVLVPLGSQARGEGPVPPAVAQAFASAGLPVLRQRMAAFDFSAPLVDGTIRKLSDLRGKVVFLNFWATWCGPCRQEMPSIEALHRRFKDQGLEVLAVNCREGPREVSAFMEAARLSFGAALDTSGRISGTYGITGIPATFIIDRQGRIIARIVGSLSWDNREIFTAFETLLKS